MDEVELVCAVYDEGTMLTVKVARGAKVSALQEAIAGVVSTEQHTVQPRLVTLFLAKKNDAWLKSDNTLKPFLIKGRQENSGYVEMIPNWTLNDDDYFGDDFHPRPKEIHVLVELPTQVAARSYIIPSLPPTVQKCQIEDLICASINEQLQLQKSPKRRRSDVNKKRIEKVRIDAKCLLEKIKAFEFDPSGPSEVPFPSLQSPSDRFVVTDGFFKFQFREAFEPLYQEVKNWWLTRWPKTLNVVGTVGYGKSHILATMAVQLLKNRLDPGWKSGTQGLLPFIIYIPSCRPLSTTVIRQIMEHMILLNFPDYSEPLETDEDVMQFVSNQEKIVIADQWKSIDEDNESCNQTKGLLEQYLGVSRNVRIHGMSMNSTVWRNLKYKQTEQINHYLRGGFSPEEFQVWMKFEDKILFDVNKEELVRLTGCVPLLLVEFSRLYDPTHSWEQLVQKVLQGNVSEDLRQGLHDFYKSNPYRESWYDDVWTAYSKLAHSTIQPFDRVDHRFMYTNEVDKLVSTGQIVPIILFQIWKEGHRDDTILKLWSNALQRTNNPSSRGFLVEEVVKAKVAQDGIVDKFQPADGQLIVRFSFQPGKEELDLEAAMSSRKMETKTPWMLLDPDIFNYGGVDVILVTDSVIVGINVTIASSHSPMTSFFNVWQPIANKYGYGIKGVYIALEHFRPCQLDIDAGVIVVQLKNLYQKLWEMVRPVEERKDQKC
ncbi:hypothetical protein AeNC1_016973 [Aphanomyces euteiches]|nr:hypothetical protein AeNC1_016973 [Aphanomyces euteiches]